MIHVIFVTFASTLGGELTVCGCGWNGIEGPPLLSSSLPSVVLFVGVGVFRGIGIRTFCPHFGQLAFCPARLSWHSIICEHVGQENRMGEGSVDCDTIIALWLHHIPVHIAEHLRRDDRKRLSNLVQQRVTVKDEALNRFRWDRDRR
jgi:hypothetical protein